MGGQRQELNLILKVDQEEYMHLHNGFHVAEITQSGLGVHYLPRFVLEYHRQLFDHCIRNIGARTKGSQPPKRALKPCGTQSKSLQPLL